MAPPVTPLSMKARLERNNSFTFPTRPSPRITYLPSARVYTQIVSSYTNIKVYAPKLLCMVNSISILFTSIVLFFMLSNVSPAMAAYCPTQQYSDYAIAVYLFSLVVLFAATFEWRFYVHLLVTHTLTLVVMILIFENRIMQFRSFDLSEMELQFYEVIPDKLGAYSQCLVSLKITLGMSDFMLVVNCFYVAFYFGTVGWNGLQEKAERVKEAFQKLSGQRRTHFYTVSP